MATKQTNTVYSILLPPNNHCTALYSCTEAGFPLYSQYSHLQIMSHSQVESCGPRWRMTHSAGTVVCRTIPKYSTDSNWLEDIWSLINLRKENTPPPPVDLLARYQREVYFPLFTIVEVTMTWDCYFLLLVLHSVRKFSLWYYCRVIPWCDALVICL